MYKHLVRENMATMSTFLFLCIFGCIQYIKPSCLYGPNGSIREFGIGYKNKTILPMWLLSLVLGILSYLTVWYYVTSVSHVF